MPIERTSRRTGECMKPCLSVSALSVPCASSDLLQFEVLAVVSHALSQRRMLVKVRAEEWVSLPC